MVDSTDPRDRGEVVARLRGGRQVIGTWNPLAAPAVAEVVAAAGFDVVLLDLEHGEFGTGALPDLLRAVEVAGAAALVRVRTSDQLGPALDAGAAGVLLPNVQSVEEVEAAVAACRYAPRGERGAAPMVRDVRYGHRCFVDHHREAAPLVGVQVEGPQVLEVLDEVLSVEGLDLVFVGPHDLSQRLGVPGEVSHPDVVAAIEDVATRCRAAGVATGVWSPDAATAQLWLDVGIGLVTVTSTTILLAEATQELVAALRGVAPDPDVADRASHDSAPNWAEGESGRSFLA